MISQCTRRIDRDKGLTINDWKKFFEANPSPWVYKAHADAPLDVISTAMNARAFVNNVQYFDDHFTYDLHLLDGFTEEDMYNHTVEPLYGLLFRHGKPVGAEIKFLELAI